MFVSRLGGYPFRHLFLEHANYLNGLVFMVQNLKENLGGDVVWEIAYNHKVIGVAVGEVQLEKIACDEVFTQLRKMLLQISHGFFIQFDDRKVGEMLLQKELGKHTHTGAYLKYMCIRSFHRLGDAPGNILIFKEMLP